MTSHLLPQLVKEFPATTVLIHDGCEFRTSQKLLNMGMACCSQCGSIFSTFPVANFCTNCNEHVLVLTEGIEPKPVTLNRLAAADTTTKEAPYSKRCPSCSLELAHMPARKCKRKRRHYEYRHKHSLTRAYTRK